MTRVAWIGFTALALAPLTACGDPCLDDGFGKGDCPGASGTDSVGGSGTDASAGSADPSGDPSGATSASASASASSAGPTTAGSDDTTSGVVSATGDDASTGTDATDTGMDSGDSSAGTGATSNGMTAVFCTDGDSDGFGDPTDCVDADPNDPPPGTVPMADATDCDDGDPDTFPGAAPNDDPLACMNDDDGDDWGDWDAGPGVVAGADCDDTDVGIERCALLVTNDGTADHPLDQGMVGALGNQNLTVLLGEDVVATPADAGPASIVVLSETALSTEVGATWRDLTKPVIVLEALVWDDMEMSDAGTAVIDPVAQIVDDAHPIAAGLSGIIQLMIVDPGSGIFHVDPPAAAQIVVGRVLNPAQIVVYAFETGDAMLGGFVAPAPRVGFGVDVDGGVGDNGQLAADGLAMFEAAVAWCLP